MFCFLCIMWVVPGMLTVVWEQAYDTPRKQLTDEDQKGCGSESGGAIFSWFSNPVSYYLAQISAIWVAVLLCHVFWCGIWFGFSFLLLRVNYSIFVNCIIGCILQDRLTFLKEMHTDSCLLSFCEIFFSLCAYENHS